MGAARRAAAASPPGASTTPDDRRAIGHCHEGRRRGTRSDDLSGFSAAGRQCAWPQIDLLD
jgi:hypothetical protein